MRFQARPGGEASEIILHVNMRDRTNVQQQEVLGILGVNLIYGSFHSTSVEELLTCLGADLTLDRLEIDLVSLSGPEYEQVVAVDIGLGLVMGKLAEAVLFGPEGAMVVPGEIIRKRPVIVAPSLFSQAGQENVDMLTAAGAAFAREIPEQEREPLLLMELSVESLRERDQLEPEEVVRRLQDLRAAGQWVLLSRIAASYDLTTYFRRYSQAPIRISMGISTLAMLFAEEHFADLPGVLLESIGRLFAENVKIYVH